jgi:putative transposase
LKLWFDAARWCYNETVARLKADPELKANWMQIKTSIIRAVPERLKDTPYQVRSIAVRDACRAMSEVKRRNKELGPGLPGGEYHELRFRSRKAPKQGCFVPATAVSEYGTYHTLLGRLRMAERLPRDHGDSRLTLHNGQYHLAVTMLAQQRVGETQARVVALDPGIRSFLTWFSETDAGHIAPGAFGKIQRLCAHLDKLLPWAKEEKRRLAKRNKYQAADRMRVHIVNLIDELHHQAARWLVDNFDVILLPTFETSDMTKRGARKLRAKSVRSLLTYAHYRFQQFLIWKAWQTGKDVILVNEAYTSKTCSWSGEIIGNLGGRRIVAGSDGTRVDRDINGARGIFLRALGDTPALHVYVQGRIGNDATGIGSVC